MTLKRLILALMTLGAIVLLGSSLVSSWNRPQIQSRLETYQADLILQAAEFQPGPETGTVNLVLVQAVLGDAVLQNAAQQYQRALNTARDAVELLSDPVLNETLDNVTPQRQIASDRLQEQISDFTLCLGLLQAKQDQLEAAQNTWRSLLRSEPTSALGSSEAVTFADPDRKPLQGSATLVSKPAVAKTAAALLALWQAQPQVQLGSEVLFQQQLAGWFRDEALARLYQVQDQPEALTALQHDRQRKAQKALVKLVILGSIPALGLVFGGGLLVFLLVQRLVKGKTSLLALGDQETWTVPWDWEIPWQVLVVGFFWMGQIIIPQIVLPLGFSVLSIDPTQLGERDRAATILISYGLVALGGIGVLYTSLQPYRPLPSDWFRFWGSPRWLAWGIGGYLVATPLVVVVSLINQQIWQDRGGSNPILPIALESGDQVAILCFFLTAAVAAPLFEESLFRGFLLPSLTRYMPTWGAIGLSSLLFAIAHLSLSEVLPLATLGAVLGFVYSRSRNLLAPILLHSLWNSGTLISLLVLGSAS